MIEIWIRVVGNMIDRVSGSMNFRFILQPVMASIFGIVAGLKDAKTHKPPYFWERPADPTQRAAMMKDGWKDIGKIFILALVLDVVYQIRELHFLYPGEAVIVAAGLAIVSYLFLRGLVNRLASRKQPPAP